MSFIAGLKKAPFTPPATTLALIRSLSWSPPHWPSSSHRSSTDHRSCANSAHASNIPPSSPSQRNPKLLDLMTTDLCSLTSVAMKSFERLVLAYLKDTTGPLLDPLQFAYRANRSVDDAVNMGLHFIMQHLDRPGSYLRILFVDFSSAFNTIILDTLQNKLTQLSVPTSICQWINSFLTDRQQLVRLGKYTSSTCTISTGAPQGCVLSPLLFSLYINDCTSRDPSVKLLKFADDTTLISLIQDGDKSAYRQERRLRSWLSDAVLTTWSLTCSKLWR